MRAFARSIAVGRSRPEADFSRLRNENSYFGHLRSEFIVFIYRMFNDFVERS